MNYGGQAAESQMKGSDTLWGIYVANIKQNLMKYNKMLWIK